MSTSEDRIVYTVRTAPGGVDGRDHTDKGGTLVAASYYKSDVAKYENDTRYRVKPIVLNLANARAKALAKLDPIDRLVLEIDL